MLRTRRDREAVLYATFPLALVYRECGERMAASLFRRALGLGPNLIEAFWELGRMYDSEQRRSEAAAANRFSACGTCRAEAPNRVSRDELSAELSQPRS